MPRAATLDLDLIRAFPKLELHIHVEACLSAERIEQLANEVGVPMPAHSGESSGPEGMWDALNYLHVDRIDHGVRDRGRVPCGAALLESR